jgi:hypothetical protein
MRYIGRCPRCGGELRRTWLRCADGSIEKMRRCVRCDEAGAALDLVRLPTYRQTLRFGALSVEWSMPGSWKCEGGPPRSGGPLGLS